MNPEFGALIVEVRTSGIHGQGVFAARNIAAGERIGVYAGRRYEPGNHLEVANDNELTYVFALSDGRSIDGAQGGNATAHLNHSCEPNCNAVEEVDRAGQLQIVFEALVPIASGAELFIDYALQLEPGDKGKYQCLCRRPRCRGSMAEVVARSRRRAKPATSKS